MSLLHKMVVAAVRSVIPATEASATEASAGGCSNPRVAAPALVRWEHNRHQAGAP